MDRDEHSQALTLADSAAVDRTKITQRARDYVDDLKWACINIQAGLKKGGKKRPLCDEWSERLKEERDRKISKHRLRRIYDKWSVEGDASLVNKLLCGKPKKRLIPGPVEQQFWGLYLAMHDKASVDAAWRTLMQKLLKGDKLQGGHTWRSLFMGLHPSADLPEDCPWNHHNPPPGWSLSNFRQLPQPDDVVKAVALRGIGAAKAILARHSGVLIDWASLRVGECIMIDDHDLDFRCIVQGQRVRLRLIVLREVRTRRVLAYVARPRLKEEDGTERSITRRDVQHLLAGWLWTFGLPRDYICYLHCENAAAAVTADLEALLDRVTGGLLKIDRTGLYRGVVQRASFAQSGGTPTGKAIIESGFRLLDIELAHIRGATGRNYLHKPEEHQGRLNYTADMMKRINALPDTDRAAFAEMIKGEEVKLPFPSLWEAHKELSLALQRMDARTWHEMEGFLKVQEFRMSPDSRIFYPLNTELYPFLSSEAQAVVRDFMQLPDSIANRFLSWGRERAESPAECWMRLMPAVKWVKISQAALFELMLDVQKVKYNGQGALKLEIDGRKMEYRGTINAAAGDVLTLRFNADNPLMLWAQDHTGRVLGTLELSDRVNYHDADTMRERVEYKAVALAHATQAVRSMEMTNDAARAQIADNAYAAALLTTVENEHARPVPSATIASPTSDALLAAVERNPKGKSKSAGNAWRTLQKLKRSED